jgi:hypothetical protein
MSIPRRTLLTVATLALWRCGAAAQEQAIDPNWLSYDAGAQSARFQLIAGLTGLNGALNFNGYRDGELTFLVPVTWKTEIDFRNHHQTLAHSAEIIARQTPLPGGPALPAIPRAFTTRLEEGLPPGATDTMRFTAEPAGDYLIWCGVLGHGLAGMWIRFDVSATANAPAIVRTSTSRD